MVADQVLALVRAGLLVFLHDLDVVKDEFRHSESPSRCLCLRCLDDVLVLYVVTHSSDRDGLSDFVGVEAVDLAFAEAAEERQFAHDFEVDDGVIEGIDKLAHLIQSEDVYIGLHLLRYHGVLAWIGYDDAPAHGLFVGAVEQGYLVLDGLGRVYSDF